MVKLFDIHEGKVGIYRLTSPNGKVYIGQSNDIGKRMLDYKRRSCKRQIHLYNSLSKHGFESHSVDILHELPEDVSQNILDNYEIYYIAQHKVSGMTLMNIREGGSNGKLSESTKLLISNSLKGRPRNYIPTEEFRNNISKRNSERGCPDHIRLNIINGAKRGSANPASKLIHQYTLGGEFVKTWSSVIEAANYKRNSKYIQIIDNAKGRRKSAQGFIWSYTLN